MVHEVNRENDTLLEKNKLSPYLHRCVFIFDYLKKRHINLFRSFSIWNNIFICHSFSFFLLSVTKYPLFGSFKLKRTHTLIIHTMGTYDDVADDYDLPG